MSKLQHRKAIGLTGGIATGKSTAARMFKDLGVTIIDADGVARKILQPGAVVMNELADYFGEDILTKNGELNRPVMLNKLIHRPADLKMQLEILAPHVLPVIDFEIADAISRNPGKLVIAEAPLLFEYSRRDRYGDVIVVAIPRPIQIERLAVRAGKSEEWAARVVDLQISIEQKICMSDYVIDNSGDVEEMRGQVKTIFETLVRRM